MVGPDVSTRCTRAEAIEAAGRAYAEALHERAGRTPREAAEAAWRPTNPYTVDEIEAQLRALREPRETDAEHNELRKLATRLDELAAEAAGLDLEHGLRALGTTARSGTPV